MQDDSADMIAAKAPAYAILCVALALSGCAKHSSVAKAAVPSFHQTPQSPSDAALDDLDRAGKASIEKLKSMPASWTADCTFPDGLTTRVEVLQSRNMRRYVVSRTFYNREPIGGAKIVDRDGLWHVIGRGAPAKFRPFEAPEAVPWVNDSIEACQVPFFTRKSFTGARFDHREGADVICHAMPDPKELADIAKMRADFPLLKDDDLEKLKGSRFFGVDLYHEFMKAKVGYATTARGADGLLAEFERPLIPNVKISNFHWLEKIDPDGFSVDDIDWKDLAAPLAAEDLNDVAICSLAPADYKYYTTSDRQTLLVNLRTGDARGLRLPEGFAGPICFLSDRRWVIVFDAAGSPMKFDLTTLKTAPLPSLNPPLERLTDAAASPDGRWLAVRQAVPEDLLASRIRLVDLHSGASKAFRAYSETADLSWTSDSKHIVFEAEPQKNAKPLHFDLHLLGLDGTSKIIAGPITYAVAAPSGGRIYFCSSDSSEWSTCDSDGKDVHRVGDGLKGHSPPVFSPDGKRMLMTYWGIAPFRTLKLLNVDGSNEAAVPAPSDFLQSLEWR